jgi:hypothetical protein
MATANTLASSRQANRQAVRSRTMDKDKAFKALGRFKVIRPTPDLISYKTSDMCQAFLF